MVSTGQRLIVIAVLIIYSSESHITQLKWEPDIVVVFLTFYELSATGLNCSDCGFNELWQVNCTGFRFIGHRINRYGYETYSLTILMVVLQLMQAKRKGANYSNHCVFSPRTSCIFGRQCILVNCKKLMQKYYIAERNSWARFKEKALKEKFK